MTSMNTFIDANYTDFALIGRKAWRDEDEKSPPLATRTLSFLEAVLLPLIEQIGFRTSQVHDLRAAVSLKCEKKPQSVKQNNNNMGIG